MKGSGDMEDIKISVDYNTHGYTKIVSNNKADILKVLSEEIDDNVKQIYIKKEPAQKVSVENC